MKITDNQLQNAFVQEVDWGEVPVWAVDHGETPLYPDTVTGVKKAKFHPPEQGTAEWCLYTHAMNTLRRECSERCNIILSVAGHEYSLRGRVYGKPVAQMTQEGLVTFPDGKAPSLQELSEGVRATFRATIPSVKTASVGGNQAGYEGVAGDNWRNGNYVSRVYTPALAGTEVRGYCTKGQKKVSTGNRIIATDAAGHTLLDRHIQKDGHGRSSEEWSYGTLATASESVTLAVVPHQARGPWGGYLVYPAFEWEFSLGLEGIVFCQENDN